MLASGKRRYATSLLQRFVPDCVYIYGLAHPQEPHRIRYVGKTNQRLERRLSQHFQEVRLRPKALRCRWLAKLLREGVTPVIFPLEVCTVEEWEERERLWIGFLHQRYNLKNVADGGDTGPDQTGFKHSPEARAKIAEAGRKRVWKSETREKMRRYMLKRPMKPEWVAKMAATRKGIPPMQATLKAAVANRGRKRPAWLVTHLRAVNLSRVKPRPVKCVETGQVFRTYRDAAIAIGGSQAGINQAVRRGILCHGYRFVASEWKGDQLASNSPTS